jgi:hypothetical protein
MFLLSSFATNRHGPVDQVRAKESDNSGAKMAPAPAKECPECLSLIAAGYSVCPDCGYEFLAPDRAKHDSTALRPDHGLRATTTDCARLGRFSQNQRTP